MLDFIWDLKRDEDDEGVIIIAELGFFSALQFLREACEKISRCNQLKKFAFSGDRFDG